jgi:CDP-glucose 4,6-dehydratase
MVDLKKLFNSFYSNKKVLVTGHTGFKGSWLAIWLNELGANVTGYSLPPNTNPNHFEAASLKNILKNYFGDVRNFEEFEKVIKTEKPEIIFHLAAQPIVGISYKEPKLTYETNVIGLVNLLEIVRKVDFVKEVIIITTDKCYENKEWERGYKEEDRLGGRDPYSSSKACAELVASAYRSSFFKDDNVKIATTRAGNVIGGGDWSEQRIIPDCVKALSQKLPVKLRHPNSIRPWQHVLESLSGYLLLGSVINTKAEFADAWNFGPGSQKSYTVKELVKAFVKYWGAGDESVIEAEDNSFHESNILKLDCSKAKKLLNWESVWDFEKTAEETGSWYKSFYKDKTDIYKLSVSQIKNYISSARKINLPWSF